MSKLFSIAQAGGVLVDDRPNGLLVKADDLGFPEAGAFGSEIRPPTIDRLAEIGVAFTDFHAPVSCSPTRAMLLS